MWFRKLRRGNTAKKSLQRKTTLARRIALESLEVRALLTTNLFLDFGFNFPVGGLVVTDAQMAIATINGPSVFGLGHTIAPLLTTVQSQSLDLNNDTVANLADAQILAGQVMTAVQRIFEPFNVLVQMASAANITDIANALGANGNGVGNRDAYMIVAGDDPPPPNDAFGWSQVDAGNGQDNTSFAFADEIIRSVTAAQRINALASVTSHEAGHSFGLRHTEGTDLNVTGDVMDGGAPTAGDYDTANVFTRFPLRRLQSEAAGMTQNAFDLLANPGTVGLLAGSPATVTGTGAHDRITVTRANANTANVIVESFSNPAMLPAQLIGSVGYSIDTTAGVLLESGAGDDLVILDADINQDFVVRAGNGNDQITFNGTGAFTPTGRFDQVVYQATGPGAGVLDFGAFDISFSEFEPITLNLVAGTLFIDVTDSNPHAIVLSDDGVAANGMSRVTLDGGLEDITFMNPTALLLNAGISADTITQRRMDAGFAGPIRINGNGGDDALTVDVNATALVVGPITYDGGAGTDLLTISGTPTTAVNEVIYRPGLTSEEGRLLYENAANAVLMTIDFINLEPVLDAVPAPNITVEGIASNNAINYTAGSLATRGRVSVDNFEPIEFTSKDNLNIVGLAGSDVINLNNPTVPTGFTAGGLKSITVDGGDPTASDTLIINGTIDSDPVAANAQPDAFDFRPVSADAGTVVINDAAPATINLPNVAFGLVEHVIINGQGGDDDLTVTTPALANTVTLTPGTAVDESSLRVDALAPLSFKNIGAGGSLTITDPGAPGARVDQLTYLGTAAEDIFTVEADGDIQFSSTAGIYVTVTAPGVTALVLSGLAGDDVFNINAQSTVLPFALIVVSGGEPSASDELNLIGTAGVENIVVDLEATTITGLGPLVAFVGIEDVNVDGGGGAGNDTLVVNGLADDERITYSPTGVASGTFFAEGVNTVFTFAQIAGLFTIEGGAGDNADEVIVQGTNGRDEIRVNATAAARTVTVIDQFAAPVTLKPVTLANSIETLTVLGRNGNDTVRIIPAPGVGGSLDNLRIHVDGGSPGASDALVIESAVDAAGVGSPLVAATDFVIVRRGLEPNSGVVRVYRSAAAMPDISYENIEVVSPNIVATNLLILGPDPFEGNESRLTATDLGSGVTLNAPHLSIFPDAIEHPGVPEDADWFRVVADVTGTLDFRIRFRQFAAALLPGAGDLQLQVFDVDGTEINATGAFGVNDITNDERIRIPAVAGQTYYLRVFGAVPAAGPNLVVNGYDLSIINTPALVPYGLELDDTVLTGSDTGRSQFDNVTSDTTPTLFLRLDDAFFRLDLPGNPVADTPPDEVIPINFQTTAVAGYRIAIFDEGPVPPATQLPQVPLGFATNAGDTDNSGVIDGAEVFVPGVYKFTSPALSNGSHFLSARVQMIDPSNTDGDPATAGIQPMTGFGARSLLFEVIVDTASPTVSFGDPAAATDGLIDLGGVTGQPGTFIDNKTNDSRPEFWGFAEANSIVRLFADLNDNGTYDPLTDVQIAETVALPFDGTNQLIGRWRTESDVDLNNPDVFAGLGLDGVRRIFVTAEDQAGNESTVAAGSTLVIFLDTQGPRIISVVPASNAGKPAAPSPVTTTLTLTIRDLPNRAAGFLNPAANPTVAINAGHYRLVGDSVGLIPIKSVTFVSTPQPPVAGQPATGTITLEFFEPLPDDRYTLTVSDEIVDDVGNRLDGDNGIVIPIGTGDGVPGGDFVSRFTIDSRPELASWAGGSVYLDLNGNFRFDPDNADPANRDVVHTLGLATDYVFAGKFVLGAGGAANGFDGLATFGRSGGRTVWQIDRSGDQVPEGPGVGTFLEPPGFNPVGQPIAGNFDGLAANGDEVGLFTGTHWIFDSQHDFSLANNGAIATSLRGLPIVGDFDGDKAEDLGTYSIAANTFFLSLSSQGGGIGNPVETTRFRMQFNTSFIGGRERPVAGDMNNDGADDIGLWVPDRRGVAPRGTAEWYFVVSRDTDNNGVFNVPVTARIAGGFIPFTPEPFGDDLFARFGDEFALPVVGNFDPPGLPGAATATDATSTPPPPQTNSGNDFVVIGADRGAAPQVRLVDRASGEVRLEFNAFAAAFRGGVRVATADLNADGVLDIIAAAGPGGGPHVRSFNGRTGEQLTGPLGSFYAFDPRFGGGVFVATGDVNGDRFDDVIVAAGAGGGPHVRVLNGRDGTLLGEFYAYAPRFGGGVHVAAGDVDADGNAEIITGAGAGGGPHVRVFDTAAGQPFTGTGGSFYAYDPRFNGGVFVAAGDVDGDGRAEIITGAGAGGGPHVKVIRASTGQELASFYAYAPQFSGGVRVGVTDFNGDSLAEITVAAGPGATQRVRVLDYRGQSELAGYLGQPTNQGTGAFLASPRPPAAQVALASPSTTPPASQSSNSTTAATDSVLSQWNTSNDAAADALLSATSSSNAARQARLRAALLAMS